MEKIKKQVISEILKESIEDEVEEENLDLVEEPIITEVEEFKTITKLSMQSRKMKVKISKELLQELENLQIHFTLN